MVTVSPSKQKTHVIIMTFLGWNLLSDLETTCNNLLHFMVYLLCNFLEWIWDFVLTNIVDFIIICKVSITVREFQVWPQMPQLYQYFFLQWHVLFVCQSVNTKQYYVRIPVINVRNLQIILTHICHNVNSEGKLCYVNHV